MERVDLRWGVVCGKLAEEFRGQLEQTNLLLALLRSDGEGETAVSLRRHDCETCCCICEEEKQGGVSSDGSQRRARAARGARDRVSLLGVNGASNVPSFDPLFLACSRTSRKYLCSTHSLLAPLAATGWSSCSVAAALPVLPPPPLSNSAFFWATAFVYIPTTSTSTQSRTLSPTSAPPLTSLERAPGC